MASTDSTNATPVPQMSLAELSALAKRLRNHAESIVLRDQPEMQRDMRAAASLIDGVARSSDLLVDITDMDGKVSRSVLLWEAIGDDEEEYEDCRNTPLQGDELRALRRLKREMPPHAAFVFMMERNGPFSTAGFGRPVERAGAEAGLPFKAHPHMLRHACGYKLANDGHDTRSLQAYLGHRNIQHTVRYSELSVTRFNSFWK